MRNPNEWYIKPSSVKGELLNHFRMWLCEYMDGMNADNMSMLEFIEYANITYEYKTTEGIFSTHMDGHLIVYEDGETVAHFTIAICR